MANLSRSPQFAQLDLTAYKNQVPLELFGRTEFPRDRRAALPADARALCVLLVRAADTRRKPSSPSARSRCRWRSPSRRRSACRGCRSASFPRERRRWLEQTPAIVPAQLRLVRDPPQSCRRCGWRTSSRCRRRRTRRSGWRWFRSNIARESPSCTVYRWGWRRERKPAALPPSVPGSSSPGSSRPRPAPSRPRFTRPRTTRPWRRAILDLISGKRRGANDSPLDGEATDVFKALRGPADQPLAGMHVSTEPFRSTYGFGDRLVFRWYYRMERGPHPEVEAAEWLAESGLFPHVAPLAGALVIPPAAGQLLPGRAQGLCPQRRRRLATRPAARDGSGSTASWQPTATLRRPNWTCPRPTRWCWPSARRRRRSTNSWCRLTIRWSCWGSVRPNCTRRWQPTRTARTSHPPPTRPATSAACIRACVRGLERCCGN